MYQYYFQSAKIRKSVSICSYRCIYNTCYYYTVTNSDVCNGFTINVLMDLVIIV